MSYIYIQKTYIHKPLPKITSQKYISETKPSIFLDMQSVSHFFELLDKNDKKCSGFSLHMTFSRFFDLKKPKKFENLCFRKCVR